MIRHYYLDDYADEVVPCKPTLEAWAAWLAKPDLEWGRNISEADGAEFAVSVIEELGTIEAVYEPNLRTPGEGKWLHAKPPAEADQFVCRVNGMGEGWDADTWGGTIEEALSIRLTQNATPGTVYVACCRSGRAARYAFRAGPPPRMDLLGEVQ